MSFKKAQASQLQKKVFELYRIGEQESPLYFEEYCRLSKEIFDLSEDLFSYRGSTSEEEALLCVALLMGYTITVYNYGDKEEKKQEILRRALELWENLPDGLLKCQLPTYCYGEVFEAELAREAWRIIRSWKGRELSEEEKWIRETLEHMESHPYPAAYIEN